MILLTGLSGPVAVDPKCIVLVMEEAGDDEGKQSRVCLDVGITVMCKETPEEIASLVLKEHVSELLRVKP